MKEGREEGKERAGEARNGIKGKKKFFSFCKWSSCNCFLFSSVHSVNNFFKRFSKGNNTVVVILISLPLFLSRFLPSFLLSTLLSSLLFFSYSFDSFFLPSFLHSFLPSFLPSFFPSFLLPFLPNLPSITQPFRVAALLATTRCTGLCAGNFTFLESLPFHF